MDIHSFISPILFITVIVTIIIRLHKNDDSIDELFATTIFGGSILLIMILLIPIMFYIIFNKPIDTQFDLRQVIIFVQYYFTLFYYSIILSIKHLSKYDWFKFIESLWMFNGFESHSMIRRFLWQN